MTPRSFWAAATGACVITLIIAFIGVQAVSLRPNARQWAALPRVPLPVLAPGHFSYVRQPDTDDRWPTELLFVRMLDSSLKVYSVPYREGRHRVGWVHFWMGDQPCDRFEPDFVLGQFLCHHQGAEGGVAQLRWDLAGNGLNPAYGPMTVVDGVVETGQFVILGVR